MKIPPPPSPAERLRQIQAVTDTDLARLSLDDMLAELLERVRDLLDVDTAVVLVLDSTARRLVTTAALGLGLERHRLRLALDGPFAAQIATEQRPLAIAPGDGAGMDPALRMFGVRSLLGVPLIASGSTVGVLHVGSRQDRTFSPADIELLQLTADRLALAAHARMAVDEQHAAHVLANSLIPSRLPAIAGLELAARYLPAEQGGVGGDWYDVFTLPSGEHGFVMGDVAGHGLRAAVVMGRLRSALRAYALEGAGAGEVLERLDRKIQHFEPGAMATVAYAIVDPELKHLHVSLAGHFPPALAVPGEPAALADVVADPPIGVTTGRRRQTTTLAITPGMALCFFTDGLIERRDSAIDDDLQRLCGLMTASAPDTLCAHLLERLLGSEPTDDDVAVLALRAPADGPRAAQAPSPAASGQR